MITQYNNVMRCMLQLHFNSEIIAELFECLTSLKKELFFSEHDE